MKTLGNVKKIKLETVEPNDWNPNQMTPDEFESLRYRLQHDGWYASQALLIWGTDEAGTKKNIIIDGEHRWRAARELGFETGPAVVLDGVPEAKAKALTVALDKNRGKFNPDKLADVLKDIQFSPVFEDADLAKSLGFMDEELMKLLAEQPKIVISEEQVGNGKTLAELVDPAKSADGAPITNEKPNSQVRMVQLFFTDEQHTEFMSYARQLADQFKTSNVTDTVFQALREAAR